MLKCVREENTSDDSDRKNEGEHRISCNHEERVQ